MDYVDAMPVKKKPRTLADELQGNGGWGHGWGETEGGGPQPQQPPPAQGGWKRGWGETGGGPAPLLPPNRPLAGRPGSPQIDAAPPPPQVPGMAPMLGMQPGMMYASTYDAAKEPKGSTVGGAIQTLGGGQSGGTTQPPSGPAVPSVTPAAPGVQPQSGLAGLLEQFASGGLQNPSRWDSGLMQQGAGVIEESLNRMRGQGMQSLDEQQSARGLVGSSVEQDQDRMFETDLQRQGREGLFNLQREAANTYAQDRQGALNAALGSLGGNLNERQFQSQLSAQDFMRNLELLRLLGMG